MGCLNYKPLNIDGFRNIADEGIIALVNGSPQLQSLDISHCGKITYTGIMAIANGLPQLKSLDISGCMKISREGQEIAKRINSRNNSNNEANY